jgi:proteasome accessory factor B
MSNQIPETLHWVMSFGSHVKVLNPPELVSLVKEEIKNMKKIY